MLCAGDDRVALIGERLGLEFRDIAPAENSPDNDIQLAFEQFLDQRLAVVEIDGDQDARLKLLQPRHRHRNEIGRGIQQSADPHLPVEPD